jgi:hypothetical protein
MTPGERLALLKKEQGSLAKVMAHENDTTYMIYTDDGDIVYKSTKLPVEETIGENYLAKFKSVDCKMIDENKKGMGQFSIEKDEHDVCHIVLKTYEIDKVTTAGNFLTEVTSGAANVFDVKVSLTENDITVTIHANTIKKNKTTHNLKIYATEKGDPHFIIEQFLIDGNALHKNKTVTLPHSLTDITDISIYTSKIYDKYVRV